MSVPHTHDAVLRSAHVKSSRRAKASRASKGGGGETHSGVRGSRDIFSTSHKLDNDKLRKPYEKFLPILGIIIKFELFGVEVKQIIGEVR